MIAAVINELTARATMNGAPSMLPKMADLLPLVRERWTDNSQQSVIIAALLGYITLPSLPQLLREAQAEIDRRNNPRMRELTNRLAAASGL